MSMPFYWRTGVSQDRRVCENGNDTTSWAKTLAHAARLWIVCVEFDDCVRLFEHTDDRAAKRRSAAWRADAAGRCRAADEQSVAGHDRASSAIAAASAEHGR